MVNRAIDSKFRNTIVCIDSYEERILRGRLYNQYLEGAIPFVSLMDFVHKMEKMLEEMKYPQAFEEKRTFRMIKEEGFIVQSWSSSYKGKLATFEMKIFFRQNASWQGTLCWLEEKREESFRSALELMFLVDSALQGSEE